MVLPAQVTYAIVNAVLTSAVVDGSDPDLLPDSVPLSGQVTFTPDRVNGQLLVPTATPKLMVTVRPMPFALDGTGALSANLVVIPGATYRVDFAVGVPIASFSIGPLVAGQTYDLASFAPTVAMDGVAYVIMPATDASIATAVSTAGTATRTALNAAFEGRRRPAWFAGSGSSFDSQRGTYNFTAGTLSRFRTAKADALAGVAPLHISVIGDSTTARASDTLPAKDVSWPSRLADQLTRTLGLPRVGTGILNFWDTSNENLVEPRIVRSGANVTPLNGAGVYGNGVSGGLQVFSDGAGNHNVKFTPGEMCNEIWLYALGGGFHTMVSLTDNVSLSHYFEVASYVGEAVFTPAGGYTRADCLPGYVRTDTPATTGGLRVARLQIERGSTWEATIRSTVGGVAYILAVEARDSTIPAGLRVSNIAQAGLALYQMAESSDEDGAGHGLPLGIDAPGADLCIIAHGLNDWQNHRTVAAYKANLTTAVQRAKQTAPTGTFGHGTGAAGDALLVVMPQPNYATNPPDHVMTPDLLDYWRAMYQVADEQNVALVDTSWLWEDYASSSSLRRDGIHPNPSGAATIAVAIARPLSSI